MMKLFRSALAVLALAFASAPALASQGSGCMPTIGTITGLAFSIDISTGLSALISTNSGSVIPVTDCSGVTVAGQQWYNTLVPLFPQWEIYDGTNPLVIGTVDKTNHIWEPVIGGGTGTLTAAATVDLCSVPQDYISISGTTSISSFGSSCTVGQIKIVSAAAVFQITYNVTLMILPTAANITTQVGDKFFAIYYGGGSWGIVSYLRADGTPIALGAYPGEVRTFAMQSCPSGWLYENGVSYLKTTYPALSTAIGTTFGSVDGAHFNVPDSRGVVDRGFDDARGLDIGRTFGSYEADQFQTHGHTATSSSVSASTGAAGTNGSGITVPNGTGIIGTALNAASAIAIGIVTYTSTIVYGPNSGNTGTETRVKSLALYHCIKY